MKNRNGFVANSSSSSFILAFPCKAHTLPTRSMRELLFSGQESVFFNEKMYSTEELAERVLSEITEDIPKSEMLELLEYGYVFGMPEVEYPREYSKEAWACYSELRRKVAALYLDAFLLTVPDAYLYIATFDDGGGDLERYLHNGEPFRDIKHIRISNH